MVIMFFLIIMVVRADRIPRTHGTELDFPGNFHSNHYSSILRIGEERTKTNTVCT